MKLSHAQRTMLKRAPFSVTLWGGMLHGAPFRPFRLATLDALLNANLLASHHGRGPFERCYELTEAGEEALERIPPQMNAEEGAKHGRR